MTVNKYSSSEGVVSGTQISPTADSAFLLTEDFTNELHRRFHPQILANTRDHAA